MTEYISVETSLNREGVSMSVYRHHGDHVSFVEEMWFTWAEMGVGLTETPEETMASELYSVEE